MDEIREYIKICIKQNNFATLSPDKIKIISSYGHYKVFHNSDFICYVDTNIMESQESANAWANKILNIINSYNDLIKKKITFCILCITNEDAHMVRYIINQLLKLQYLKIILVGQDNTYIDTAVKLNIDYIVSSKNEYKNMIQDGLTYIKSSNIINNKIMITNTETIIDTNVLFQTLIKCNQLFNFAGPTKMKYVNISGNIVESYNLTGINDMFIPNWFLINTGVLTSIGWNIFENIFDIYDSLNIHITKPNAKILKISNSSSICFGYNKSNKISLSTKISNFDVNEYQLLSMFIKDAPNNKYKNILNYIDKITVNEDIKAPILPNIKIEDNRKKTVDTKSNIKFQTKSIIKTPDSLNEIMSSKSHHIKLNIDKIYFINNFLSRADMTNKIKSIPHINSLNYSIIDGNKNRVIGHITSIKDAITRKLNKIVIIEDKLISDGIFHILNKSDLFPISWALLLLISLTADIDVVRLGGDNKTVHQIDSFAYCINNNVFKSLSAILTTKNNLHESIFQLQVKEQVYAIYGNFNINNLILNRTGRNINDFVKVQQKIPHKNDKPGPLINIPVIRETKELKYIRNTPKQQTSQAIVIRNNAKTEQMPVAQQGVNVHDTNKIVQGLWIGESLSLNEVLCIMSFINNGHEFHLYVYEDIKNIPKECIVKDANEIIPSSEIFYYNEKQSISGQKRPTGFSNMFRYKMLYDKGGYWVDMDMICIKYLRFGDPYVFSSESTFSRDQTVNAGIIKCPKGSEFARYCYLISKSKDKSKIKWGEIGPKLVGEGIAKYKLQKYVKPWFYFCPIGYDKFNDLTSPTKLQIEKDWYCVHLWNEFWVKNKMDKNKIYYGSLFGSLVNKYCRNYVTHDVFNLELEYGKYNKSCVLFYWMPKDDTLVSEMESYMNGDINKLYNINTCYVHKEYATANKDRITNFINSDIYVYMFTKLLELGIIDNLHIIFGMAKNDKYVYNNEPLFTNGNCYNHNNKIYLWKLNDIKSLFSFTNAKMYFYKGYGNYEHFYSMLQMISPQSIYLRYLATALPFITDKNSNIVIDDKWIDIYARNDACKKTIKNFNNYLTNNFTKYDLVYVDTAEKIPNYKKIFINAKHFIKLDKYSLMKYDEKSQREYDLVFCASDVHPSKNWEVFYQFLAYCDKNKKELKLLIITPVISKDILAKYTKFRYVHTTIKRGLTSTEMNEYYNKCKCLMVTFGRDANPRVISESMSCGCYNIVLDILSDGKDVFKNNPIIGKLITVPIRNTSYEPSYKSIKCVLTPEQHNDIYNLIKKEHDHKLISETFLNSYNADKTIDGLYRYLKIIESTKQRLIVTLATENYSKNINYLLASIVHTNPDQLVVVYYIGWRDSLINQFKNNYPKYHFEEIKLSTYTKGDIIKLKVKMQHDIYFKYMLPFIWIDADSIVIKSLNSIFDKINNYNLICYHRPDAEFYMKFAVGVIAFGCSNDLNIQKLNEEFLINYYENSKTTSGHNNWFYDQTSLHDTYEKYKSKIKLYPLTEKEHSINDTADTIIYSRRLRNKKHIKEMLISKKIPVPFVNFEDIVMKYD